MWTAAAPAEPIAHTEVIDTRASSRDGYLAIQKTIIPLGVEYAALPVTANSPSCSKAGSRWIAAASPPRR